MAIDADTLQMLEASTEVPELDLSFLNLDESNVYGVRPKPGRKGLTLSEIEIGPWGSAPDHSTNHTLRLRGVRPRVGAQRLGYTIRDKSEVWSENALLLYEEAVQRQWSSATDIPWQELRPLPDDIERAVCQFCTFLTEVEFIAGDTPGQWLPVISGDYYEIGLFLMSQIMDEARHMDVFRKRALANGGGLLQQGNGSGLRILLDAKDFTEMSVLMHVLAEGFVQSLFRMGELIGPTEVEKRIMRMAAQDESRHLAFGVMHLKYVIDTAPERREEIHHYLDREEDLFNRPDSRNAGLNESLLVLLGGGRDKLDQGFEKLLAIQKKQVNEYIHRLDVAGLGDRRERVHPAWKPFIEPARA